MAQVAYDFPFGLASVLYRQSATWNKGIVFRRRHASLERSQALAKVLSCDKITAVICSWDLHKDKDFGLVTAGLCCCCAHFVQAQKIANLVVCNWA